MREGGVLVLPNGANREEFINPSRIYPYVKANAVSWYQFYNGDSERETSSPISNGTVYIVTGVDRADSWATAVFPRENGEIPNKKKPLKFKYVESTARSPWRDSGNYNMIYNINKLANGKYGVVFLRLMAVALSPLVWSENVAYVLPEAVPRYSALLAPKFSLRSRIQKALSRVLDFSGDEEPRRRQVRGSALYWQLILLLSSLSVFFIHRFLCFTQCFWPYVFISCHFPSD